MTKRKKTKADAIAIPIPQDDAEANDFVREIGTLEKSIAANQDAFDSDLALLKAKYDAPAAALKERLKECLTGLQTYCEANRARLTNNNKVKFYAYSAGKIEWRQTPPAVTLRNVKEVTLSLKRMGLSDFIRRKEEIDKEAILRRPQKVADIPGITITSKEEFKVTPVSIDLVEPRPVAADG